MSSADAVAREAAWLTAHDPSDGLPALLTENGGPFDIAQAYLRRTPAQRRRQLYVLRRQLREERTTQVRRMARHHFELRIIWPASSPSGSGESPQQALDAAVELVLQRIGGLALDKTHGGRFLSAAENPGEVVVDFTDPEPGMRDRADLCCTVTYWADDIEISG